MQLQGTASRETHALNVTFIIGLIGMFGLFSMLGAKIGRIWLEALAISYVHESPNPTFSRILLENTSLNVRENLTRAYFECRPSYGGKFERIVFLGD